MDVRLTDYGVSQFSSPSGLRSMKGTEEYMAPELCKYGEQSFYDEKVSRDAKPSSHQHWDQFQTHAFHLVPP